MAKFARSEWALFNLDNIVCAYFDDDGRLVIGTTGCQHYFSGPIKYEILEALHRRAKTGSDQTYRILQERGTAEGMKRGKS